MDRNISIIKDKKELIEHLELPNSYYSESVPETVQAQITKAKSKERSDIPTYLWGRNKYAESTCLQEMITRYNRDDIPREDCRDLSVEQFREKYEKHKKPVVITGVLDEWKQNYSWKWSVR